MQAQSVPSNALTVISHEELDKIKGYGLEISEKASEVFDSIHAFVRWISSLQRSAQWYNAAALEFSHSLRQSRNGQSQRHIRALENVVWQVIENPGWILKESNVWRNRKFNLENLKKSDASALRVCEVLQAAEKPIFVDCEDERKCDTILLECSKCQKTGALVLCGSTDCINRYHWTCSGVKKEEVRDREFYCADCDPSFLGKIVAEREKKESLKKIRPLRSRRSASSDPSKKTSDAPNKKPCPSHNGGRGGGGGGGGGGGAALCTFPDI